MPVQRLLALLLAAALLAGSVAVSAQDDATPGTRSDTTAEAGYTAAGDPLVGTGVPYVDDRGEQIGVATVVEITDPWDDFADFFEVDEGTRYVGVEVSVEATQEQIEADPFDFGLQTVDGFFYGDTYVNREITSGSIRDLESITVDVDDVVSGLVFYQVPEDAELARILWQPDNGRLLVLADLRDQNEARA